MESDKIYFFTSLSNESIIIFNLLTCDSEVNSHELLLLDFNARIVAKSIGPRDSKPVSSGLIYVGSLRNS